MFNATAMERSSTSRENFQNKQKKKKMMQVKIRRKYGRYMSTLKTNEDSYDSVGDFLILQGVLQKK